MDSDSDSGGSHISATPPNSPPPTPSAAAARPPTAADRRAILLRTFTKSSRTNKTPAASTSRTILKPKIAKKSSNPRPKPEPAQPEPPVSATPILSNLHFQIKNEKNGCDDKKLDFERDVPIRMSHCASKVKSFVKKYADKKLNFEADDDPIGMKFEVPVESVRLVEADDEVVGKGLKQVRKDVGGIGDDDPDLPTSKRAKPAAAPVESARLVEAVKDEVVGQRVKQVRKNLGVIGDNGPSLPPSKRAKPVNEGNFVKLNINGYGRKKFSYMNKRKGCSSAKRRWKSFNKSKGSVKGGGEENGVLDEEGLVVDIGEGQEKMDFHSELIEEAVMRVRNEASEENLLKLLKITHGYDSFRDGQLEAIKMVLSGKSTMLVLPTGAGKSLCYQLPALVFPGITVVVSPLVALMIDQLKNLSPAIPGGLLCSSQTMEESSKTLQMLQEGAIKVLFVSPERFLNEDFLSIFSGSSMLSLVVVDEVHCVSEWSHNFRPSYMRLRASLLRGKLNAGIILAMTATATNRALCDVMHALEIPPTNLIQSTKLRDNLHLSVSMSGNRMKDLMALLKSAPFLDIKSIIIYCKFQLETDMISKYLRDNNISAKSYHSGFPAKDRSRVQDLFCSNKIRVVVATVAFGMGLDKRDVGAVIHYSLPESLEAYVQEIGRAGRDGRSSFCHLLFDDPTYFKLRSLVCSDGVDEYAVNNLLCQIFPSNGLSNEEICSIVKESACRKFDMKEETILTVLTQLELGEVQYIHLLPQTNVTCSLNFHQTSPPILAARDIVVAAILKKSELKDGQYVFHIPSVANSIRIKTLDLLNHLQSLKFKGEITYDLKDQAFCYTVLTAPKDIFSLAAQLTKWLGEVETCKVRKIDAVYNAATFAVKACDKSYGCDKDQHTPCLQRKILEYFNGDGDDNVPIQIDRNSPFLRADIKVFLQNNTHAKFTPRAVARIMHGLPSPAFPSSIWSKTHFWGRYVKMDFRAVMEAAKQELIPFVGKDLN